MTIAFDRRRGLIIIVAEVHGPRRTVTTRLLLDTGAMMTLVHPATLARAGYDLAMPRAQVRVAAINADAVLPLYLVDGLTALGQRRDGLGVPSHAIPGTLPFDGLLGANFLRGRRLAIDFRTGTLDFA